MASRHPISTRWSPEWQPQWTIGLYTEEVTLLRAAMKLVQENTHNLEHKVAATGILKELEEAGERRICEYQDNQEREPTPEELRCIRDSEF